MVCGTPVIGSEVGGIVDLIRNGETGFLVPPGDAGALSERMMWILMYPEAAREMGARAREFACGYFSTEAYVGSYRRLFEQAVESSASKRAVQAADP